MNHVEEISSTHHHTHNARIWFRRAQSNICYMVLCEKTRPTASHLRRYKSIYCYTSLVHAS
jgi:hypothetical protein